MESIESFSDCDFLIFIMDVIFPSMEMLYSHNIIQFHRKIFSFCREFKLFPKFKGLSMNIILDVTDSL